MERQTLVYIALGLMFVVPGLLLLWAGVTGSSWVFQSPYYRFLVERIGLGYTRLVFVLLGLLFLGVTALVIMDPLNVMK